MRAWGSKCYTYNEIRAGFDPHKNVGYLLGYAPKHARGLYTVLGADTKRVKEAVACTFTKPISESQLPHTPVEVTFTNAVAAAAPSQKATNTTRQKKNFDAGHAVAYPLHAIIRYNHTRRERSRDTTIK